MLSGQGSDLRTAILGRAPGVVVVESGPELVADLIELGKQADSQVVGGQQLLVEAGELGQEGVALAMAEAAARAGEPGCGSHDDGREGFIAR
jgi:hypothetical protein